MTLLDKARDIYTKQFKSLNAKGINFGGRESVKMQVYARSAAGNNPLKASAGFSPLGSPVELIPMGLELRRIRELQGGVLVDVGDARLEVARKDFSGNLLTMERLLGKDLALDGNKQLRYLIGSQAYTLAESNIQDLEGVTWLLTLQKVPG